MRHFLFPWQFFDLLARIVAGRDQIILSLQIHPELRVHAKPVTKPQSSVAHYRTLAIDANLHNELVLRTRSTNDVTGWIEHALESFLDGQGWLPTTPIEMLGVMFGFNFQV